MNPAKVNKLLNTSEESFSFVERSVPFPYAVLRDGRHIIQASESLFKLLDCSINSNCSGKPISELISGYNNKANHQRLLVSGSLYNIYTQPYPIPEDNKDYSIVYFIKSDLDENSNECNFDKTVVSLIFIDNFDEVMDSSEEIKSPMLVSSIDRLINSMSLQLGGVVKKFEKDKYIFIFNSDKIEYLKQRKFEILTQIKSINVGSRTPLTLSMGIGLNGITLSQSMEYARAALDLALGRGGDQVLIKDRDNYYFYGGTAKEIGYNTRVRARVKAFALTELINESSNVFVMGHRNTDLDCLGASMGIYKIVTTLGKPGNIILNSVNETISPLYKRIKEYPDYDDAFISGPEAMANVTEKTLLIIVDTHRPSLLEFGEMFSAVKNIIVFDHHRKSTEFIRNAVLTYHEPFASSTAELVTEILQHIPKIKLLPVDADALLAGMTVDTKNFAFKTGSKTFEAAAYLRRNGADTVRVRMLLQYDMHAYKAKAIAVNSAEIFNENVAIAVCPPDSDNPTLAAALAADELLNISGIHASFVLSGEDNVVFISARSMGAINVQMIMEKLGGGGHQSIAGCQLTDTSIEEAKVKVKQAIDEYMTFE